MSDERAKAGKQEWIFLGLAAAGLGLHWLALPPLGWWPLGWVVFAPWTAAAAVAVGLSRLPWKRLWLLATLFWMGVLYFIPIPHPALVVGWPLLGIWCGLFPLSFFVVSRKLLGSFGLPEAVVLPVVWTCLEWCRNWAITGFGLGMLAHSQYRQEWIVPTASLGGACLVSLLMAGVGVAAGLWTVPRSWRSRTITALSVGFCLAMAIFLARPAANRDRGTDPAADALEIAIVQGSIDTEFPDASEDPGAAWAEISGRTFREYRGLTVEARRKWPAVDLVIWPETMFRETLYLDNPDLAADPETRAGLRMAADQLRRGWRESTGQVALAESGETVAPCPMPVALLTGVVSVRLADGSRFNSAMLLDPEGQIRAVYHKNHRVIFGEYFPLVRSVPFLSQALRGMSDLDRGTGPVAVETGGLRLMPAICFETTVPHLVRSHWLRLDRESKTPDCMVCLTNDGWFFGTSCLDLHLACGVFRAAETATPLLVAANTGFSAEIDARGRILQQGPRRESGILHARIGPRTAGTTPWLRVGDLPWSILSGGVALLLFWSFVRPSTRNPAKTASRA